MKNKSSGRRLAGLWIGAGMLVLMASPILAKKEIERVPLHQARGEIPEDQLLDIGIQVLDPGLPQDDDLLFELEEKGVFEDMREAESRYIPVRLMDTLQTTGYWGAVRVVPRKMDSVDIAVGGRIIESNGKRVILELRAVDATGRLWLERRYNQHADPTAYREARDGKIAPQPFQFLYHRIANDLEAVRRKLNPEELREIRTVSELRFATDIVPVAFADYLETDRKGRAVVAHLPSDDDPMMVRVERIRERDYLFIDTLTEHYTNFYAQMNDSYANWRQFSYEEILARNKARRQARTQQILGALAILGGIMAHAEGDNNSGALGDAAIIGGSMVIQSGTAKHKEAKMHVEALRELASSFDSEMEPLLVEVEGQTLRLTGSAEAQYAAWRQMLRDIFITETGLPIDPDTGEEVSPEALPVAAAEFKEN